MERYGSLRISVNMWAVGLMAMSQDAPEYILEHEGLETVAGAETAVYGAERESARRTMWKRQSNRLLQRGNHIVVGSNIHAAR
jgi:hypothetical protein